MTQRLEHTLRKDLRTKQRLESLTRAQKSWRLCSLTRLHMHRSRFDSGLSTTSLTLAAPARRLVFFLLLMLPWTKWKTAVDLWTRGASGLLAAVTLTTKAPWDPTLRSTASPAKGRRINMDLLVGRRSTQRTRKFTLTLRPSVLVCHA